MRGRAGGPETKVIFRYIVNLRSPWNTLDPVSKIKEKSQAGKMAPQITALVTKPEDQSLIPGTILGDVENHFLQAVLWPPHSIVVHATTISQSMENQYSSADEEKTSAWSLSSNWDNLKSTNMCYFGTFKFFCRQIETVKQADTNITLGHIRFTWDSVCGQAVAIQGTFIVISMGSFYCLEDYMSLVSSWIPRTTFFLYLPGAWRSTLPHSECI